ncbi:MAG: IS30 family transposase [Lentisphaeria bacterium]|jgi:IS30 family transposase
MSDRESVTGKQIWSLARGIKAPLSPWQKDVLGFIWHYPIAHKTKELTTAAITALLTSFKSFVHTITYDNGREFNGLMDISSELNCKGYSGPRN